MNTFKKIFNIKSVSFNYETKEKAEKALKVEKIKLGIMILNAILSIAELFILVLPSVFNSHGIEMPEKAIIALGVVWAISVVGLLFSNAIFGIIKIILHGIFSPIRHTKGLISKLIVLVFSVLFQVLGLAICQFTLHIATIRRQADYKYRLEMYILNGLKNLEYDKDGVPIIEESSSSGSKSNSTSNSTSSVPSVSSSSVSDDPLEWTSYDVANNKSACRRVLKENMMLIKKYIQSENYEAVITGIDRTKEGYAKIADTGESIGRSFVSTLSSLEAAIVICKMNNYQDSKRLNVALDCLSVAYDYACSEEQKAISQDVMKAIKSGKSISKIKNDFFFDFSTTADFIEQIDFLIQQA